MKVLTGSKNRLDFTIDKFFPGVVVFVEPSEYEAYKKAKPNVQLEVLGKDEGGFGYLMNSMVEYTLRHGDKYFLFADDDIFGMERKDKKPFVESEFMKEGEELIKYTGFAQLGVSFSGHNWYYHKKFKPNQPVWCMGFMDAEQIKNVGGYLEDLLIFNDYEMSARLIKNGRQNAIWYDYMFCHKMKSRDGGASRLYAQPDLIKKQCRYLMNKYGKACRIIWNRKHGLYEIRFNWKLL